MIKHVLMVAGDPSGDQHGAALARALKDRAPHLKISALGGSQLQHVADTFIYPLVGVGGFGFWEPIFKLPQLMRAHRLIKKLLQNNPPDVVIPIDFYGFNIHVARLAHRRRIPVVYFISPQVWASRVHRVQELAKVVTKMLVLFPFEEILYQKAGVQVSWVGHPLIDRVPAAAQPNDKLSIGLFPGSRWGTVKRHLPIMIATAKELRKTYSHGEFILFRPEELDESRYHSFLAPNAWLRLVCDPTYERRKTLSLAISVSGTAALENTLLGIPMVIMYKLSTLTYEIARRIIQIPFVAIPNILANKAIVPELLQANARPDKLAAASHGLLNNPAVLQKMRDELLKIRQGLGPAGATQRAADEILQIQ